MRLQGQRVHPALSGIRARRHIEHFSRQGDTPIAKTYVFFLKRKLFFSNNTKKEDKIKRMVYEPVERD